MKAYPLKPAFIALVLAIGTIPAQAEDARSGELALFLTIETQPGQRDTLVALWDEHLRTRAADNSDHVSYVFALDMNDPNTAYITEVYATQAAFEANAQAPWFGAYMAEVEPLLAAEPGFVMASPHWVK